MYLKAIVAQISAISLVLASVPCPLASSQYSDCSVAPHEDDATSLLAVTLRLHRRSNAPKESPAKESSAPKESPAKESSAPKESPAKESQPGNPLYPGDFGQYIIPGRKVAVSGGGCNETNGKYTMILPITLDDGSLVVAETKDRKYHLVYYPENAGGWGPAWYMMNDGYKAAYVAKQLEDPRDKFGQKDMKSLQVPTSGWTVYNEQNEYSLPGVEPVPAVTIDQADTGYMWTTRGAAFANAIHGTQFMPGVQVPEDFVDRARAEFGVGSPVKSIRDNSRWLMVEQGGKDDTDTVDDISEIAQREQASSVKFKELPKYKIPDAKERAEYGKKGQARFIEAYLQAVNRGSHKPWLWAATPQGVGQAMMDTWRKGFVNSTLNTPYKLMSGDNMGAAKSMGDAMAFYQPKTPAGYAQWASKADTWSKLYNQKTRLEQLAIAGNNMATDTWAMPTQVVARYAAANVNKKFNNFFKNMNLQGNAMNGMMRNAQKNVVIRPGQTMASLG